jgi:hypothetical protein
LSAKTNFAFIAVCGRNCSLCNLTEQYCKSDASAHEPRLLNETYIDSLYLGHTDTLFYQDTDDKLLLKIKNSYALAYY